MKEPHPLTKLIPERTDQDRLAFEIAQNGLHDPVVLYEGKIIEGRVRYRAWFQVAPIVDLGRGTSGQNQPPTRDWVLDHDGDVLDWMVRRHVETHELTELEKIQLTAAVLPYYQERPGSTHKRLGDATGLSIRKVRVIDWLQQADAIDPVLAGEKEIFDAGREIGLVPDKRGVALGKSYGAGDKFDQAVVPLKRYLAAWKRKGYQFRHVNPKEAARRVSVIDSLVAELLAAKPDLQKRSVEARLSAPPERKVKP